MATSSPWPIIERHRNQVVDLLNAFAADLAQQYPDLEGRVVVTQREDASYYILSFYLLNHKLRGYNTRLFSIEQPMDSDFPVELIMHYKTYSSAPQKLDVTSFEPTLRKELASPPTQNILNNLLALGDTMSTYGDDLTQSAG